ncbi:MAG TPA: hypothetical protein VGF79_09995, partial [Bacteroidia bacterium]
MNSKSLLAIFAITFSIVTTHAATRTWTGNTSTDWATSTNWSGNSVPTSSDDVVISNGSASNQPELDQDRSIASLSVSAGTLDLNDFELTVTGNASFTGGTVQYGWINATNFTSMQNTTFTGLLVLYKTGGSNNDVSGGNTFNGPIAIINDDDSRFRLANLNGDDYNGIIHFEERSTGEMQPAYNGNNTFDGDISSVGSPNTVTFGSGGSGVAIIDGTTSMYGSHRFERLNVNTSGQINMQENQTITTLRVIAGTFDMDGNQITSTDVYFTGGTVTDGTLRASSINSMQNTTFAGLLTLQKTGSSNNTVNGGNTFNETVRIVNSGSGLFRMANTTGDDYNGDVEFNEIGTGDLEPAYNGNNTFAGEISTDGTSSIISFGGLSGNGIVIINGNSAQQLVGDAGFIPTFRRFTMNTSGTFLLNNIPLVITNSMSLTSGIINSSSSYQVIFRNSATVTGAKNSSHVNGPVVKIGTNAFTFPVGDGTYYAGISIGAPGNSSDEFTATYFNSPYVNTTTMGSGMDHVSTEEHWILDRTNGNANVTVTLSWDANRSGTVNSLTNLRVARWSGSNWSNQGNGSTTGNATAGTVISSSAVTDFSPFTLGSANTLNPLPIQLISFDAIPNKTSVNVNWATSNEVNNDYFIVEKSFDGNAWFSIGEVDGAGNSDKVINYTLLDTKPVVGIQYYRLIQVDLNGKSETSAIVPVRFNVNNINNVVVSPNPATGNILNVNIKSNESAGASISIY